MTDQLIHDALRLLNRHAVTLPTGEQNLAELRRLLDPLLFDGDVCRDDVAEVCQKIDDAISNPDDHG